MNNYFDKFPQVNYANTLAIDITKRVKIIDTVQQNPYIYYPYNLENFERADQLANKFYDDPYLGWITWISNSIIDPLNEWYSTEEEFYEFIKKKYGTLEKAENEILYFRVKFPTIDDIISQARYNELSPIEFKYWEPVYENEYKLTHYKRKELDWKINTNFVIKYTLDNVSGLNKGDRVDITLNGEDYGKGSILLIVNNDVWVQSIEGFVFPYNTIQLNSSGRLEDKVITSLIVIKENISRNESKYWEPVSSYAFEYERNEYNKGIRIIDKSYVPQIITEFKKLMNE